MAHTALPKKEKSRGADYTLLLQKLENAVLHSSESTRTTETLKNKEVWQSLEKENRLKWASLAQIAGEIETALEVYKSLTLSHPDYETGWEEYLELLSILDRNEMLAAEIARASQYLTKEQLKGWQQQIKKSLPADGREGSEMKTAQAPFEKMIWQRELMALFLDLFSGREDVFARQWADKQENKSGYVPVRQPFSINDLEDHINGRKTCGIYILQSDSRVKCAVIDADLLSEYRSGKITREKKTQIKRERSYMISRIRESSLELGLKPLIEFSGFKGFHFWYFFKAPVDASLARSIVTQIADPVNSDLATFDLEVFPKQGKLSGKGLGNLVKLPLGIHRFSGKKSFFVECPKQDLDSQLYFLKKVEPVDLNDVKQVSQEKAKDQVVLHPRMEGFAREYPELYALEKKCPPLGQIIASCREKRPMSVREEKVLFQTIGFLPAGKRLMHYLMAFNPEYNPHMVDFQLSRLRGTPLGCRRIHSLLSFTGSFCELEPGIEAYLHPLLHLEAWKKMAEKKNLKSRKVENLNDALENLQCA
ncbi:MAG: CRISPR-associated primase-polymerase type A1, partial [Desulfobacteraceae bacterium]